MRLRYVRDYYDLSQKEVAKVLNVARSTYSLWEAELNVIPLNRLIDFCNYFNVSMDYVLGLSIKPRYKDMKKVVDFNLHRKRLRRIRKENNCTQVELAEVLNTDNGVISRYENGKYLILTSFLIAFANYFNISVDYIMGRIDEPEQLKVKVKN